MAAESWPGGESVRIRIGVHSGQAYAVGNRFVGLAVHETVRMCAAAKGGQILVSESVAAGTAGVRDTGDHELHGVGRRRLYVVGEDNS